MIISSQAGRQVGDVLRYWRRVRRLSQMDLAIAANVSARHLSFVETGRSKPSHDLLIQLSEALQLPPRHANLLFVSAGYAPCYSDWALDDDRMENVRLALEHLLNQHDPYPAMVINRTYDILMTNNGYGRLSRWLTDETHSIQKYTNIYRLVFASDGLQQYFVNWDTVYPFLLKRLREESIAYQSDALAKLYDECVVDTSANAQQVELQHHFPVMTFALQKNGRELEFFSTMTTFGTAIDVTTKELRLESLFPANANTRQFFNTAVA